MKPNPSYEKRIQIYNLGFVVLLVSAFLFVMLMSRGTQGPSSFDDSLYKKTLLIENLNRLRLKLGDRVFNNVLIDKNGWMEYIGDENLDDYQHVLRFKQKALRNIGRNIQSCYQYAQEQGITFLIVVAPNKATIYPDKLPDEIQPLSDQSRLDQLDEYLEKQDIPKVLDLRPALLAARRQEDIYYRMGTHWNEAGAYVGYATIINALSQDHPELIPYSHKFLRFRHDPERRGDTEIARMIQANYLSLEPNLFATRNIGEIVSHLDIPSTTLGYHKITWIPDSNLPSAMIFHDSFGVSALNSFLSLNFSKASYIFRHASPQYLNRDTLEVFSPDIVIYEVAERNLHALETDLTGCAVK